METPGGEERSLATVLLNSRGRAGVGPRWEERAVGGQQGGLRHRPLTTSPPPV